MGLLGITVPADDGGAGMDPTAAVLVHEELSSSDSGLCLAYLAHTLLFVNNFFYASNDEQRALNYLAVRYPAVYAQATAAHAGNASMSRIDVRPSRLSTPMAPCMASTCCTTAETMSCSVASS